MSTASPGGATNSVYVTILGLITLLLGGAYAAFGGWAILVGLFAEPNPDPFRSWFGFGALLLLVFGLVFLPLGILTLLAACGVLLRRPWGRMLTIILAVLAILLGLLWVSGVQDVVQDATDLALGVFQVLYGILAFFILITNGAEFFRPRI